MKKIDELLMDATPEFRDGFDRAIAGMPAQPILSNCHPQNSDSRRDWFRGWDTGNYTRENLITLISFAAEAHPDSQVIKGIIKRATGD